MVTLVERYMYKLPCYLRNKASSFSGTFLLQKIMDIYLCMFNSVSLILYSGKFSWGSTQCRKRRYIHVYVCRTLIVFVINNVLSMLKHYPLRV